jgi:hypothetical protein
MLEIIEKVREVVGALIGLGISILTLITVIKAIIFSIRK